ncbi:transporter [Gemmobacter caeruleus]|uniref:transporter n=1 Tax=Gemmobacter caeruleus TaxID=2595004 RepID=UPI001EF0C612|nr:transporter [Gemmobacter caeruleus]
MASVAVVALMPWHLEAQVTPVEGCQLVDGRLPEGCVHSDANTVVTMPVAESAKEDVAISPLGETGYSIIIDGVEPGAAPQVVEGTRVKVQDLRQVDQQLTAAGVEVKFDRLGARTRLAVSTDDLRRSYAAGDQVTFRASSNYPAYIAKSEVRILDRQQPGRVVAVLPVRPNGTVNWVMPAEGSEDMVYALRVYDSAGRYDETRTLPISRSAVRFADPVLDGPITAAGEGEDMTRRRSIPVAGGSVLVTSDQATPGTSVMVMGEAVPVDPSGRFVVERILPPGMQDVRVGVGGREISRKVEIPKEDWFYFGMVDLTVQDEGGDTTTLGRVAGYAKGTLANGVTITGSIDTREDELDRIFNDLGAKEADHVLRRIRDEDVYPTFGDDSTSFEDAPTSGKLYLKVQKDNSYVMWGDFQTAEDGPQLVRSDRTLYGLNAVHESAQQTSHGEPRLRFSAYAAQPDRLAQRDVLRGTGGSTYFLKRQDILTGTATVYVQWRDPVTGLVVRQQRLIEGEDYEVNYFQGLILLKRPLPESGAGGGLVVDRPLGQYDVNLVAQYEYVPTTGNVDGMSTGARVEAWVTDNLRIGASALRETTGLAENDLVGIDMLLRHSERTYLSAEYARSEGPGFGSSLSLNGGLDFGDELTVGAKGRPAESIRLEAQGDLAELSNGRMQGTVSAYYDKKEAGFVSSDYDIDIGQEAYGLAGDVKLSARSSLTFGYEKLKRDNGERREDARIGTVYQIDDRWKAEAEIAHTDRFDPTAVAARNGTRTDAAVRLTWTRDADLSAWFFGQSTLHRSGGLPRNDRVGIGAKARVSEKLSFEAEISDGSLGSAGHAMAIYEPNAGSQFTVGYRLDPMRQYDEAGFSGTDGGVWVVGAQSRISDALTMRAENTYDRLGDRPSLSSSYGVTYTPNDQWAIDGAIIYGTSEDPTSGTLKRRGISMGVRYAEGERLQAGLSGEFRREDGSDNRRDRKTWGISGYARYRINEDLRLLANIDALVSESDQSSLRDGKYVEANLGLAYRPVNHDRFNALLRYTYLYDLPGPDQVNFEGNLNGPRQKSHIFSADVNYDITQEVTVGAKLGYRKSKVEDRGSTVFTDSTATLGILRFDYHVTHSWDIMAEARAMKFKETGVTETGAVLGVWRHFGNNLKAGIGYQWGDVSSDLREIEGRKEGAFFNIVATF